MRSSHTRFEFQPPTIHHGIGCVAELDDELETLGRQRALVVTGRTVGSVDAVMDPISDGLGDRLIEVFDEVTPAKTVGTAAEAAEIARERDVDVLVGVGGGGTLDTTKQISVLSAYAEPREAAQSMVDRGSMSVREDEPLVDIVAIPTTLPGADLSTGAGVGMTMETDVESKAAVPGGGVSDGGLMPAAVFYDAELVATTPRRILARSAMNGYDKGIEMLYARHHTPFTDATASRGVRLLQEYLPAVNEPAATPDDLLPVLEGIALVQYGIASPDAYRASIIHAFGHALTAHYPIQQGVAHAIAAPHVLAYLFDEIDARRDLLADALGVTDADDTADAVIGAVEDTRNALGLPSQLRTIDEADRGEFPSLATAVLEDSFMAAAPTALEPTQEDLEQVFEAMW